MAAPARQRPTTCRACSPHTMPVAWSWPSGRLPAGRISIAPHPTTRRGYSTCQPHQGLTPDTPPDCRGRNARYRAPPDRRWAYPCPQASANIYAVLAGTLSRAGKHLAQPLNADTAWAANAARSTRADAEHRARQSRSSAHAAPRRVPRPRRSRARGSGSAALRLPYRG